MCLCLAGSEKGLLGAGPRVWEGRPTPGCFLRFPFSFHPRLCTCCVPIILGGWQLSLLGHLSQPQRTSYRLPGSGFSAAQGSCSLSVSLCVLILFSMHIGLSRTLVLISGMGRSFRVGLPAPRSPAPGLV